MPSLTVAEARERAASLTVRRYDVSLDLTTGDQTFESTTRIEFDATTARTFLDIRPERLVSVTLNGLPVDVAGLSDGRLELTDLAASNELVVDAVMAYSNSGEGLHRTVDVADGEVYLYAMSFLDAAPRTFACFDQPDLKAPFAVKVRAPDHWVVFGNGPVTRTGPGHWELVQTRPLSTYFVTLVAGPYHTIRSEHDGIPLGLACRKSLAEHLDRESADLLTVTRQSFDEYHRLFGYRYPFGEYHQVFVPEFNAGAMENPGCVTFRDELVFRSAVTDAERSSRARTVVHEMAHQWFGDTVTMTWWNDLWLNESFAEYMAHRVAASATGYSDNWLSFAFDRKWWGMMADQRASTHPVAGDPTKDARTALDDFDGISYAKGAAALKQLAAYLGDDVFLAGIRAHITGHEFGNASLADLLGRWTEAGGVGLDVWTEGWLRTPGMDTIRAERTDRGVRLVRTAPAEHPARRPHKLTVGGYDAAGNSVQVPVLLDSETVEVELDAAVVIPDAGDDTWAKVRLDPQSLEQLPAVLPAISSGVTRAVIWNSLRDATADAELDPRHTLDVLLAALAHEPSDIAAITLLNWAGGTLLRGYLPYEPSRARVAETLADRLGSVPPGSSLQLAITRGFIRTTADGDLLRRWLTGDRIPGGLTIDADLRWLITLRLSRLGAFGETEIDAELDRDKSTEGIVHATRCRAALPTPQAKERAWTVIATDSDVANYELYATCEGFWHPSQLEVTAPYVDRYFAEMPGTAKFRSGWVVSRTSQYAFPGTVIDESVIRKADALLADHSVDNGVRRAVSDEADDLRRALHIRRTFDITQP